MKVANRARIYIATVCLSGGVLMSLCFHSFWFLKMWAGAAIASPFAFYYRPQWMSAEVKQCIDEYPKRWGSLLIAAFALYTGVPHFVAESQLRSSIRSLTINDVKTIHVTNLGDPNGLPIEVTKESRRRFAELLNGTEVYNIPNQVLPICSINLLLVGGNEFVFEVWLPNHGTESLVLSVEKPQSGSYLILPGARRWLDEVLPGWRR